MSRPQRNSKQKPHVAEHQSRCLWLLEMKPWKSSRTISHIDLLERPPSDYMASDAYGRKPRDLIKRPGISSNVLIGAGIRYSDYPEDDSIEIPYWNDQGEITRFKRWRLPNTRANGQKYHQEPDSPVYAYYPPNFFRRRTDPLYGLAADSVVLCEGEFKALSLLELGVYTIGLPSFNVYTKDAENHRHLLRDIQVTLAREKIKIIYFLGDSDTATNFEFSRQAAFLASAAWPARVFLPRIPIDQPKGVDDCKDKLAAGFDIFFSELIRTAIQLPHKCEPPDVAILIFERELTSLKTLRGVEREKQFNRIVKLCVAAQIYAKSQATARLCKLSRELLKLTATEFKNAINEEQSKAHRGNGNGQESARAIKSVELELVDRLIEKLPPIKTRGEDWFVYQDGIWTLHQRHHYEPDALEIIEPESRRRNWPALCCAISKASFK
jgi:hypothetical protein